MVSLRTVIGALILVTGLTGGAQAQTKWVFATGLPESNFLTHEIRAFVKDAEALSKGKVKFEMHENSTLIKRANIRRALELGQIQIGDVDTAGFGNEDPMFVVENIPGVAPTTRHLEILWQFQRPYYMKAFQARGLTVLFNVYWPGQGFSTKSLAQKPEDFKGLKLRIYSKSTQEMGNKMGFDATILPFAEVPQAFATGLINSLYTSAQTNVDVQAWDHLKYYYYVGGGSKMVVAANTNAFKQLDGATREAIIQAARNIEAHGYIGTHAANQEKTDILKKNGMTVMDLPEPIMKKYKEVGEEMLVDWRKQVSPEAVKLLADYQAFVAKM
ncbi:MAG: TRAP transporter substrate-binding protein DctP [Proteobacteria bacterium]|nr:TRAP transporter substrate-binding protein DctP [Pseudomonadota bacterium]